MGPGDSSQKLVLGVLFDPSTSPPPQDSLIATVAASLSKIVTPGTSTNITSGLSFAAIAQHVQASQVLSYAGSLTTPPCKEGVRWLVVRDPLPMSLDAFLAFKKTVGWNSRGTQYGAPAPGAAGKSLGEESARAFCNAH